MANKILDELCSYLKLKNYQALAEYLGIKVSKVYSWSKYDKIADTGIILVKNPEINGEYLQSGKGELIRSTPTNDENVDSKIIICPPDQDRKIAGIVQIPVLGAVPAGMPATLEEYTNEYISLPNAPKDCYALKVSGESMEPAFRHDDYVLFVIDREIKNGDVVIANDEFGESMVKRYKEKDGEQFLTSDNPAYPTFKPNGEYRIMGKVIGAWRQLNI